MVVSGGDVMILDPSGDYLPPRTSDGRKRTALRRKISSLARSVFLALPSKMFNYLYIANIQIKCPSSNPCFISQSLKLGTMG